MWQRYEGPTWLVAATIYGGWALLLLAWQRIPFALAWPVAVYLTAWHSSLQHETIHALRRVPRGARTLLATPPLGIWFPYAWYRREHLRHHATRELASPLDPESFAYDPRVWARIWPPLRALLWANQTFAGRMLLGPAIQSARAYGSELARMRRGDFSDAGIWSRHVVLVSALGWLLESHGIGFLWYVACVAYPAAALGLIRSFAEHRYAESRAERTAIVESRGALSLLFLNNNLHAVHHANPALPWYRIPQQYRRERDAGETEPAPFRGYRNIARTWLWRAVASPVAERKHA